MYRVSVLIALVASLFLTWTILPGRASLAPIVQTSPSRSFGKPTLKWQRGGCTSWCETGWYSSPAVADLDGDGKPEVIGGLYTVFIVNGEDGSLQRAVDTSGSRVWPGVVVADINADGDLEIVTAQGGGYLNVLKKNGDSLWTRQPAPNELRGLSVYDLDGNGKLEVIVTGAVYGKTNTWVYDPAGNLLPGWPQLANDSGYAYGVFNSNAAIADLDSDNQAEIVVPSDVHYICAYRLNGAQIPANAMYGGKGWGRVGVWESPEIELRGWGECDGNRAESYRANFAHGPAVIADVDGNGLLEVAAVGNVYDCNVGHPPGKYNGLYLFNADRSRFNSGGFDWRNPPVDSGAPLSEDYDQIENAQPNPVVADLDGDGHLEILFASYDGRLHAYWLDKTEHGNWPYSVYTGGPYRFASEPAVADLDANGRAEVIFATWTQKGSNQTGQLIILDDQANRLYATDLPALYEDGWNGALAAPTLANIDSDPDLEAVLTTAHSGLVAYDLPGTAGARLLWPTGRGNYQRSGSLLRGNLDSSQASVQPTLVSPGEALTYAVWLRNPGPTLYGVQMTATLPGETTYLGNLWASGGQYGQSGGLITWTGNVVAAQPVTITWGARVLDNITAPKHLPSTVSLDDGLGTVTQQILSAFANGRGVFLPYLYRIQP
jgi:uncharacterized repeat protein (TIGR01451 family)